MTTYTQLVQDVIDTVKDSQVTDAIARDFIAKAEFRISRDLVNPQYGPDIPQQMLRSYRTTTDTFKAIELPDDFLKMRAVWLNKLLLEYVPPSFLEEQNPGQDGQPVELNYYNALSPLSQSLPDNWLIRDAYDIYLWASCLQYEAWGHEDQPQFRRWYTEALQSVKTANSPQPRGRYFVKKKAITHGGYSIIDQRVRFL